MLDEKDLQAIAQLFEPINDRLDKIETRVAKTDVFIENAVNPQIQLIAEGQRSLLDKLTPKREIEALQEEVDFLKSVLRVHEKEIQELKKAQ